MGTANQILCNLQEGTTALTTVLLYSENARSGAINFGSGTTAKTITIGNNTSGITNINGQTLNMGRPMTPIYLPSAIVSTNIGFKSTPLVTLLGNLSNTLANIGSFSLTAGVWSVLARFETTNVIQTAANLFRMGLSTASGTLQNIYGDWNQDNQSGNINILLSGSFSLSATTTVYIVGRCGTGAGAGGTSTNPPAVVEAIRIA
jgi:hypothetical protein